MNTTKNSALDTALSFYYQTLVGLEKCFDLQEGGVIYFEKDGDVSFVDENPLNSQQIEVKHYSDNLTNHHENFWKTLKNWLLPEFRHEQYQYLVLCTTQPYGKTTLFHNWNGQDAKEKMEILEQIFEERENMKKDSEVAKIQQEVMSEDKETLKNIISKIVLYTEMKNLAELESKLLNKLFNIPYESRRLYLKNLIGFIYTNHNNGNWLISYQDFYNENILLADRYGLGNKFFPKFNSGKKASDMEMIAHQDRLFVGKIRDIKHDRVIPEAIGDYLQFVNSLNQNLNYSSIYRDYTISYRNELISILENDYETAVIKQTHPKIWYNETISKEAINLQNYQPDRVYKNGLIHDIMDDDEQNLKWDTEQ